LRKLAAPTGFGMWIKISGVFN